MRLGLLLPPIANIRYCCVECSLQNANHKDMVHSFRDIPPVLCISIILFIKYLGESHVEIL